MSNAVGAAPCEALGGGGPLVPPVGRRVQLVRLPAAEGRVRLLALFRDDDVAALFAEADLRELGVQ